jgi:hypothetical protein
MVADQLERLRDATEADELIVTTITHDHAGPGADPPVGLRHGSGEHGPGHRQRLADSGSGGTPLREQKFGECDFRADGPDRGVLAGWEASAA